MKKNILLSEREALKTARETLNKEIHSLQRMSGKIGADFFKAAKEITLCPGKVVLTGIGKSGIIAQKISATFSSTGTQSVFIHPVEAMHGDIGLISGGDVVMALSNSGETEELNRLLSLLKKRGVRIIGITSRPKSKTANLSDIVLNPGVSSEACPFNLVPTSSTTAMLAMGDALAVLIMKMKGFGKENFADMHPGGNLGKLLNLKVGDIMRRGKGNPVISQEAPLSLAIKEMTRSSLGAVSIIDSKGRLSGFFTDGDLRRRIKGLALSKKIKFYMTPNPTTAKPEDTAMQAAKLMQRIKIDNMPVVDGEKRPVGIIDERDLLKEGLI